MSEKRPRWRDRTFYFFVDFRVSAPGPWGIDRADEEGGDGIIGSVGRLRFAFGWDPPENCDGLSQREPFARPSAGAEDMLAWERALDSFVRERGPS
jgi:hypothetical protein